MSSKSHFSQKNSKEFYSGLKDYALYSATTLRSTYNLGQNIWHKVKKYSKIGQDFKNVISIFNV